MSSNPSKKSKLLIYTSIIILAIGLLIYLNFNRFYALYFYTFKTDKFQLGDNVYASSAAIYPQVKGSLISALRMIRPMTEEEINDIILISHTQRKRFLEIVRKPDSKPYLTNFDSYFDVNEIYKTKMTAFGKYNATLLTRFRFLNENKVYYAAFYAINPNKRIYRFQFNRSEIPEGYILADSLVYVDPFFASNKITLLK